MKHYPLIAAAFLCAAAGSPQNAFASGTKSKATSAKKTPAPTKASAGKSAAAKPEQQYVSMSTIKQLQAARARNPKAWQPVPVLQPLIDGKSLKGKDMKDLATNPPVVAVHAKVQEVEAGGQAEITATEPAAGAVSETSRDGELLAQAFPQPVRPAAVRSTPARPVTPRWVRYPLEFQLAGIGLGTRAVDKDQFNRIDRYGLFAIHGNPTSVVVPSRVPNVMISNLQQPPEVSNLFPADPGGGLPAWASAVMVSLDSNHVQWLYRRDTYSMGFVVDRLGFVDAIVVAGVQSPIARTQLEDPVHTIGLGDDLRKVLFRYGYPDTIESYKITQRAEGEEGADVATTPEDNVSGLFQADKREDGTPSLEDPWAGGNSVFRTFEIRYEQSYNVVFTIRNNRVVRIYIFGDPDFFNEQRRNALRTRY